MNRWLLLTAVLVLLVGCRSDHIGVQSPDGSIKVDVACIGTPTLSIKVDNHDFLKVEDMVLCIDQKGGCPYGYNLTGYERNHYDSVWHQPWGENKEIRENCNELLLHFKRQTDGLNYAVRLRVFDDGIGFRYEYELDSNEHILNRECTLFQFPCNGTCWSIPANFESYEFLYREQPITQTADANTPFTFRLDNGLWGSLHEANLRNMPEMTLINSGDSMSLGADNPLVFGVWLAPSADSSINYANRVSNRTVTSWRTVQVGRRATDLINSSLILNLNEPCALGSADSYRPMKYIGIWWDMHLGISSWTPGRRHGATTVNAVRYIDFAAENNIDAVLFEGWNTGWDQWGGSQVFSFTQAAPDMDIDSVIRYAHSRGVEIIIHHETGGNIPNYEAQMDSAFEWCARRGIHAVKTGYAGGFPNREIHHSKYGVNHYFKAMEKAAGQGLALDVHEPIKPTGLRRTYPNLMTGEGGRGMEWNAWSGGNPPEHQTVLPFTRLLAGPMDYTPGIFDITYERIKDNHDCQKWNMMDSRDCRVHTTLAHQVALWVVLYSPLQMAADLIENYDGHPMFQFFRDFNPDCDWSEAVDGEPGQYITVVRRAGNTFYLGAVTNGEERTVSVPLGFLPHDQTFEAIIYADGADVHHISNPTAYRIDTLNVTDRNTLTLHLAPGGGAAVCFKK